MPLAHFIISLYWGIEHRKIFLDDADRNNFIDRIGGIGSETKTTCYAWALISNHAHILLRTGQVPAATVMRRLLTGLRGISINDTAEAGTFFRIVINLFFDMEERKLKGRVAARSLFCFWAVREFGASMTEVSRRLKISLSDVSQFVIRGEKIAEINRFEVLDE